MLLLNEELKQEAVNEANFNTSYVVIKPVAREDYHILNSFQYILCCY